MNIIDADKIARKFLDARGCNDYSIVWERSWRWVQRVGYCDPFRKLIHLSRPIIEVNDENFLAEILAHEAAHGVAPHAGHGEVWVAISMAFGGSGRVQPVIPNMPGSTTTAAK